MVELVVARYQEDVAWVRNVSTAVRVTLYNKGASVSAICPHEIFLPNIGREAHTYLHHIINRYDSLSEVTVFVQGKPFDHAPDLHKILRELANSATDWMTHEFAVDGFRWLGFLVDTDDKRGRKLFVPWSKNLAREELPLDEFYRQLFEEESPDFFRFFGGAQFIVKKETILRRPKEFYQRALHCVNSLPLAAHCMERIWDKVFGVNGVPEKLMQGRDTLYLKKIRRLEDTNGA